MLATWVKTLYNDPIFPRGDRCYPPVLCRHPTLLNLQKERREGEGGGSVAWRKKKRLCSILFLWQMYKKRSGGLRFPAQSDKKKNKRRNKVAAFVGSITSSCSENEPALLPPTERKWLRSLSRPPETQTTTTPGKHFRRQIHSWLENDSSFR